MLDLFVMAEKLGETLVTVREAKKLARQEMAEQLGVHLNTLAAYERSERLPGLDFLISFAAKNRIDFEELLELRLAETPEPAAQAALKVLQSKIQEAEHAPYAVSAPGALDDEFALVPLYDVEVSAGPGREVLSEEPSKMLAFRRDWLREMGIQNGQAVVVTARGDSMEPTIAEGDTLLVDQGQKGGRDGIYIMSQGGVLRVKRLQWLTNGDVRVMSDCSAYQDETVCSDSVARLQIVGRVVWGGRRF